MAITRSIPVPSFPRGSCLWGLLLGLALLPLTARAEVSSEVRRYALSIHQLIQDLEYERALEQVARAKKVSKGPEDDALLSLYEGLVLAELSMGRQSEADAAFQAALFLNPDATLPMSVSPKLRRRFEAVRKKVLRELAARGEPPDALKTKAAPAPQVAEAPREPLPPVAEAPREPLPPAAVPVAASAPVAEVTEERSSLRKQALIPAIGGGVLALAGGAFWLAAEGQKSKLDNADGNIRSRADAHDVASRARTLQTVSGGLLMGGVVGLGVATGMYLMGAPKDPVAVTVGTDGTSAFVSGRWP